MSMTVEQIITGLERALWIVDHAVIVDRPTVDAFGRVDPEHRPSAPEAVADKLERYIRPSNRGVRRVGLTPRLWLALLILAAYDGHATIARMHSLATGNLPREMKWELGILTKDAKSGQARELTAKQLYNMAEKITEHLDLDPNRTVRGNPAPLTPQQREEREAVVMALQDALIEATHVLPHTWGSYAVDESGVWAWVKGKRANVGLPPQHPADEDSPTKPADQAAQKALIAAWQDGEVPIPDEDLAPPSDRDPSDETSAAAAPDEPHVAAGDGGRRSGRRAPLVCWMANWGVKTHKSGRRASYYGYALHAVVRVPDPGNGDERVRARHATAEPLLIEQVALTSASTDLVEPTLEMVRKIRARGHRVTDLLGDRHYSYKAFDRWAAVLWRMRVRPVADLRANDHGATYYEGAQIIAGTPHCSVPQHLLVIERPGDRATKEEWADFDARIEERRQYALARVKTPWQDGDDRSRWRCPARNGTVGCPRLAGSVEIAIENGLPIIAPPEAELAWCEASTATIPAGKWLKYLQEECWGSKRWRISFDRRTYIEGVFGNLKNHHSGNMRRGFMCFTGMPLVTLAITAAVVAYNMRELENWYVRAEEQDPKNPLLAMYAAHPLHQRTEWQHGFTMLTSRQRDELDEVHSLPQAA